MRFPPEIFFTFLFLGCVHSAPVPPRHAEGKLARRWEWNDKTIPMTVIVGGILAAAGAGRVHEWYTNRASYLERIAQHNAGKEMTIAEKLKALGLLDQAEAVAQKLAAKGVGQKVAKNSKIKQKQAKINDAQSKVETLQQETPGDINDPATTTESNLNDPSQGTVETETITAGDPSPEATGPLLLDDNSIPKDTSAPSTKIHVAGDPNQTVPTETSTDEDLPLDTLEESPTFDYTELPSVEVPPVEINPFEILKAAE